VGKKGKKEVGDQGGRGRMKRGTEEGGSAERAEDRTGDEVGCCGLEWRERGGGRLRRVGAELRRGGAWGWGDRKGRTAGRKWKEVEMGRSSMG